MVRSVRMFGLLVGACLGVCGLGLTAGCVCEKPLALTPTTTEIVVAPDAPKTVRFAADELSDLLSACFGTKVDIVTAPTPGKAAVVLGDTEWSRAAGIDVSALPRDGYVIDCTGSRVVIAGRDDAKADPVDAIMNGGVWSQFYERATLFGVYEFLERYAGVRMYFPGELGTITPRTACVTVPRGRFTDAPVYDHARRYSAYWDGDYPEEIRMKRGRTPFAERVRQLFRNRGETMAIPCCHGSNGMRYVDRFGESHPEYFALLNPKTGKRSLPTGKSTDHHTGQLCWTSGVTNEMCRDILAYFRGEPASARGIPAPGKNIGDKCEWNFNCRFGKYVDVMPQDGFQPCQCERCKAAYSKDDPNHFATELIWGNTVNYANALKAAGLPGYVVMMAYPPYRRVPAFDIPDNVLVQVAVGGPWSTANPEGLAKEDAEIAAWVKKLGHKVWLWNYACKGSTLTMPNVPQITPNAYGEYYSSRAHLINGAFAESESDRFIYNYLNYYIFSKVCWNPSCDWKKLLDEHYTLMYGPGAAAMKRFNEILERKWLYEIAGRMVDTPLGPVGAPPSAYDIWTKVYSPAVLAELDGLLKQAVSGVAAGSLEARRVALMRRHIYDNLVAEARKYMDRIDPKVEDAWRTAHPDLKNLVHFGTFDDVKPSGNRNFGVYHSDSKTFEGWYGSEKPGATVLDEKEFRSAPRAMRLTVRPEDIEKGKYSCLSISEYVFFGEQRLKPSTRYRLSFYMKLKDVSPLARGGGVTARVVDAKNVWFPRPHEGSNFTGSTDWIAQSYEFVSDPDTNAKINSNVSLELRQAVGTVWFDDVRLEELE